MPFKKGWSDELKAKKQAATKAKPEVEAKVIEQKPEVQLPIYKALYISKEAGVWCLHMLDIQDGKIVADKVTQSINKAHAIEDFQIRFAKLYFLGK